jgi:hypothetical protein
MSSNKDFYRSLRLTHEPRFLTPFERKLWHNRVQQTSAPFSPIVSALIGLALSFIFFLTCLILTGATL